MSRTRVAVLGGGAAGVSAAFWLTATPELRERYQVTVHQLGWRLGGKGASGRNGAQHDRIEEHGLHIWFGFYDNAFDLIKRCYRDPDRPRGSPLPKWRDAFKELDTIVLYEQWNGQWVPRQFTLPRNPLEPGQGVDVDLSHVVAGALRWLQTLWGELISEPDVEDPLAGGLVAELLELADELGTAAGELMVRTLLDRALAIVEGEAPPLPRLPGEPAEASAVFLLRLARDALWEDLRDRLDDDRRRFVFMAVDFWAALLSGILGDDLHENGFGAINHLDLRDWLESHGARRRPTLDHAPFVRGFYDLIFGFEGGDTSRPNVAAGKAVQALLRILFTYQGAMLWKMQAGMGDAMFAPLYQVLHRRGVRFEFLHWITRLGLSDDRSEVDTVELIPQARALSGDYEPLCEVKGLPCWPSEPDWEQLADADRLRGIDLERERNPLGHRSETLALGRDFDKVVLAIPVGALEPICAELADHNPSFREMLEHSRTVVTQAFQLWFDRSRYDDLGSPFERNSVTSSYVEPLDTYCNMTHLVPRESWPSDDAVEIAYLCGVLEDDAADSQQAADALVRENAIRYIERDAGRLFPRAVGANAFRWELLYDRHDRSGADRFDAQFWRANFQPDERYVTTPAGSVEHRLWPRESGFANLYLAGDWTRNGINGGSVEAAVTSGMLAAQAISGSPTRVRGISGWLERD